MEVQVNRKSILRTLQENIVILWFLCQAAFLISFGNVGSLPLTIPFLISIVYIGVSVVGIVKKEIVIDFRNAIYGLVMLGVFVLAFFLSKYASGFASFALYLYYFSLPVLLDYRGFRHLRLEGLMRIFIFMMVIFSIYGIYQFLAYNFVTWLPFKELVPSFLRTDGYNTIAQTHQVIAGRQLYRAHSILDEPSTLSRMCSIAILFLLMRRKDYSIPRFCVYLGVNAIAMALTLSGSGIIFFAVGIIVYFIVADKKSKIWLLIAGGICLVLAIPLLQTEFAKMYTSRLGELASGAENTSGFYRFRLPFRIGFDRLGEGVFGYGFGNDDIAIRLYGGLEEGIPNGFGKMFVDVGIFGLLGLVALFFFLLPTRKKYTDAPEEFRAHVVLLAITAVSCLMSTFMSPIFWSYVVLMRGVAMADARKRTEQPEQVPVEETEEGEGAARRGKILLFMTTFYNYHLDVQEALKKQGWDVTWFSDKVDPNSAERLLNKIAPEFLDGKFDRYFDNAVESVKQVKFDRILIIFGAAFMKAHHIEKLRRTFPGVPLTYYAWDSVVNFPRIKTLFSLADHAYTFDSEDAETYGVGHLPLFFVKRNREETVCEYDASTVMSFYYEKYHSLKRIYDRLSQGDRKIYMFLRLTGGVYRLKMKLLHRHIFKDLPAEAFSVESLPKEETLRIFAHSRAIIDCPLPGQNGLTMRTFEVLACNKKLITTNKKIANYDFYTPNNILIVEDENTPIPDEFFTTPFDVNYEISDAYSVDSFVARLTAGEDAETV